jgi:hypothetical protein
MFSAKRSWIVCDHFKKKRKSYPLDKREHSNIRGRGCVRSFFKLFKKQELVRYYRTSSFAHHVSVSDRIRTEAYVSLNIF